MYEERELVITKIKYKKEAEYFKDVFPDRIGSTIKLSRPLRLGHSGILPFVSDKDGNPKTGLIATGIIYYLEDRGDWVLFEATEGIYALEKAKSS